MSIPSGASLAHSLDVQSLEVKVKDGDVGGSHDDALFKETGSRNDKYTILLEKHLSIVESELRRLKGQSG